MSEKRYVRATVVDGKAKVEPGEYGHQVVTEFQPKDPSRVPEGASTVHYGSLTDEYPNGSDKTYFQITVENLRTCGWTGSEWSSITGLDREVDLVFMFNDKKQKWRIQYINDPTKRQARQPKGEADPAFIASLNARMKPAATTAPAAHVASSFVDPPF